MTIAVDSGRKATKTLQINANQCIAITENLQRVISWKNITLIRGKVITEKL